MTASKAEVGVTAASALFEAGMTVCPDADSTQASPKHNRSDLARLTAIGDAQTADAQHNRSPVSIGPTRILQSAEGRTPVAKAPEAQLRSNLTALMS